MESLTGLSMVRRCLVSAFCATGVLAQPVLAQTEKHDPLQIRFQTNSSPVLDEGRLTLDQAARLFRDGNPIVMIVAGGADRVGDARDNLQLSVHPAEAVAQGLTDRGLPADRLQVLGRGTSELAVPTEENVAAAENHVVEISWR